jgi:hypothetical protein
MSLFEFTNKLSLQSIENVYYYLIPIISFGFKKENETLTFLVNIVFKCCLNEN